MPVTRVNKMRGVQAVDRALAILETLAREGSPMMLSAISAELRLNISTVHRLLNALAAHGLVEQEPYQGRYRLGIKAFEIGNRALYSLDIRAIARPALHQLVDDFNETANLAILDKYEVVYIDQVESSNIIKMLARPGTRAPAYCTGAGKVLLAYLSENQLNMFLQEVPLFPYTATTIIDPLQLREELQKIRRQGFALDHGEREEGVRCVAAPVFDHENKVIAAVSVAGPANRMPPELMAGKLATAVVQVALQIGRHLGYQYR
ncbi:Transcriptional repressor IclR [Neomoorella glycerini]|uniref:Glycerol operon regulatory protein n=1 Tax=Neomoorella glycerini TaxID=55779 RepID=A0A6I5ZVL6_9FIRM|nr:IclR family transcriptional regulator [Moorella glycerini]QGP93547.1 Transcriptional repressor IclR [Moorella glycerini]